MRLRLVEGGIVIEAVGPAREGWADAARALHEREGDGILEEGIPTSFDQAEWEWR